MNAGGKTIGALGCNVTGPTTAASLAQVVAVARAADVVVIMAGLDQTLERESLDRIETTLPPHQIELINTVSLSSGAVHVRMLHVWEKMQDCTRP
jgi:hypothetical protein